MNFKESYLVPKTIYEKMATPCHDVSETGKIDNKADKIPADVRMKLYDYNKKFPKKYPPNKIFPPANLPSNHEEKGVDVAEELVSSIKNTSRKNLANEIISFIKRRGGGEIGWTNNFDLVLNDRRHFGVDIRDMLAFTVGEIEDSSERARAFIHKLREIQAPPHFFMFYNKQVYPGGPRKNDEFDYWPRDLDSPQDEWELQGQEKEMSSSEEEIAFNPKLRESSPPSPVRGRTASRQRYTLRKYPRKRRWGGDQWETWKDK